MLKISNLNKYYNKGNKNEYHVIDNLSYEFEDTGLYVFFGPSGCGKTTLLNVIGCLDKFDSGSITYFEKETKKYIPKTADDFRNNYIGFIFQNYNLIDTMSIEGNLNIVLDMIGLNDKEERKRRIEKALSLVGLLKYKKRNTLALSGGERQRVAIARALVKDPKVLLADEPTGNLDSNNTFEIMNIIKKISKERLVILVSHEKNLVDFYADRIIELNDGMIVGDRVNKGSSLFHEDSRNIYLKDYQKTEIKDKNIDVSFYSNEDNDISFDIVMKDGDIYIKSNGPSKVHLVNDSSEVKFLDKKSSDFIKEIENKNVDFSFDDFSDDYTKDKKSKRRYISFFKAIKNGFKNENLIKRSRITSLALIISAVFFSFLFSRLSSDLNITERDYIKTPSDVVKVELNDRELNSYSLSTVYNDAKEVPGFISFQADNSYGIEIPLSGSYQTVYFNRGMFYSNVFAIKDINQNYEIIEGCGRKIQGEGEIVLSRWIAEDALNSTSAKLGGFMEFSDLVGLSVNVSYYQDNDRKIVTIVGISNEKSPSIFIHPSDYKDSYPNYYYSAYIECENKDEMIRILKEKYSTVKDVSKNAKWNYFLEVIDRNGLSIVFDAVLIVGLSLYLIFMIRATLFQKIKEIGILRSIGVYKKDIISMYIGDMFAYTTKTGLISFSASFLFLFYYSYNFSLSDFGFQIINPSIIAFIVGIVSIYFVNLISTAIPILVLLSKTPVEIIKKYDI